MINAKHLTLRVALAASLAFLSLPAAAQSAQKPTETPKPSSDEYYVAEKGFKTVDVVSIAPDNPQREAMRAKFLDEHFHKEDEVRFFVAGSGLFTLHVGDTVYEIRCEQGDLIGVPDSTTHWFDMGPEPVLKAIRLFAIAEGWVAKFTGDPIADKFPRLEAPHYKLAKAA